MSNQIKWFPQPVWGTVEQMITLNKPGRVHALGSYWPARLKDAHSQEAVNKNQPVKVLGREGIVLLVEELGGELNSPPS